MDDILFTMLKRWAVEKSSGIIENGIIVILDDSSEFSTAPQLVLELESSKFLGRLTLKDYGKAEIGCAEKKNSSIRSGECDIFTEGQLENTIEQLLEWMGCRAEGLPQVRGVLSCPDRKVMYFSRREARATKKAARLPEVIEEYRCRFCGMWHLGTKRGRNSVKRRTFRN
jgi:hypothetical protein